MLAVHPGCRTQPAPGYGEADQEGVPERCSQPLSDPVDGEYRTDARRRGADRGEGQLGER